MYRTEEDLIRAMYEEVLSQKGMEAFSEALDHLWNLYYVYGKALEDGKQYGYIGVGLITYAESALVQYQMDKALEVELNKGDN